MLDELLYADDMDTNADTETKMQWVIEDHVITMTTQYQLASEKAYNEPNTMYHRE